MAKRAYQAAGYNSKQALKASMLLSIQFIDETGDSELRVRTGDQLSIESGQATFTRHQGSTTETFTVIFEEEARLQEEHIQEKQDIKQETRQASAEIVTDIKQEAPFVQNTNLARQELGLQDEEMILTSRDTQSLPEFPDYQFSNFSFGSNPYNTDWLVGYNPNSSDRFLIVDSAEHKIIGKAQHQRLLNGLCAL